MRGKASADARHLLSRAKHQLFPGVIREMRKALIRKGSWPAQFSVFQVKRKNYPARVVNEIPEALIRKGSRLIRFPAFQVKEDSFPAPSTQLNARRSQRGTILGRHRLAAKLAATIRGDADAQRSDLQNLQEFSRPPARPSIRLPLTPQP